MMTKSPIWSRSRATAIVPALGVVPPSMRLAQSSTREAPPSCAASAEETPSTHASTSTPPAAWRDTELARSFRGTPLALRHRGDELLEAAWREVQRLALLGALVSGHENFHDLETVVE